MDTKEGQLNMLKNMGIDPNTFTYEKILEIEEMLKDLNIKNPEKMTPRDANTILTRLKNIGIDPHKMQNKPPPPQVKKIGRNERCPCESGKKYKKCCIPIITSNTNNT